MREPIRVVIVDDSHDARVLVKTALERVEGVEMVGSAESIRDLVLLLNSEAPDVVLIDWHLPGMDDGAAVAAAREVADDIKIIVYTSASVHQSRRREMIRLGADAVVEKGDPLTLVATIEEVMAPGFVGPIS